MKRYPLLWLLQINAVFGLLVSNSTSTKAQIVPDSSLPEHSVVTRQDNTIQIDGGTRAEGNLFHSFERFSVPTGQTAFFNNSVEIRNVLSRVTGNSISEIDGIIKANGTANLFLINPNGIIFGRNAKLDIGGSFLASTASRIIFADGFEFSTTATQSQPLLTISVPIGLGFRETPGSIINKSRATVDSELVGRRPDPNVYLDPLVAGLQVQPGKTLALVGGDVVLEGGNLTANGGRIELGSVAGNSSVSLTPTEKGWVLGYEKVHNFQDISLFPRTIVDTSGETGGEIQLQGRRVTFTGDRQFSPVLTFSNTVGSGQGGTLKVTASEAIELSGDVAALWTQTDGVGSAGNLMIETRELTLRDGGFIQSSTGSDQRGRSGDLTVKASELIEMIGTTSDGSFPTAIATFALTGNGGSLRIETERLVIKDGAQISTSTFGTGRSGNLTVIASDIELIGTSPTNDQLSSAISTQAEPLFPGDSTGNAGNLLIQTERLTAKDGGFVSASTFGNGQGGDLTVNASNYINLSGTTPVADLVRGSSGLFVLADEGSSGKGGQLNVTTGQLLVEKGAKISAETFGTGEAGNITLNVNQLIIRDGGQIRASSLLGNVTSNNQRGAGGTLTVNASESVDVIGTGSIGSTPIKSSLLTLAEGTGKAGNLNIFTPDLTVRDGAEINVSATGSGDAGILTVEASSIRLDNQATVSADTKAGQGNINLNSVDLVLRHGSNITTNAQGEFIIGGNITIDTGVLAALENSNISANSLDSRGGNVTINAQAIFGTQPRDAQTSESDITATGRTQAGTIIINTPDVDPSSGLIELPENFVDASSLVDRRCSPSNRASRFVVTGSGGLPASPIAVLSGDAIDVNWVTLPQERGRGAEEPRSRGAEEDNFIVGSRIVEAQGWVKGPNGEVILTAYPPTATPHNSWQRPIDCP